MTRKAICRKCGYRWDTTSKLERITCPSCQKKSRPIFEELIDTGDIFILNIDDIEIKLISDVFWVNSIDGNKVRIQGLHPSWSHISKNDEPPKIEIRIPKAIQIEAWIKQALEDSVKIENHDFLTKYELRTVAEARGFIKCLELLEK